MFIVTHTQHVNPCLTPITAKYPKFPKFQIIVFVLQAAYLFAICILFLICDIRMSCQRFWVQLLA